MLFCFVLCIFIITQIFDLSSVFFIFFCGTLGKYHSQNHETQNTNTQTASVQYLFSDVVIVLSAVFWTLVCVIDIPTNAVANVAEFFLDVFHGLFPLSFNCLYYNMEIRICQLLFCTKELRFLFAELCILTKFGGHASAHDNKNDWMA